MSEPRLRYYPLVLASLTLVLFTTSAQFLIVSPILPRIAEDLHVPEEQLGVLVTAYAVAVGGCAFLAGPLSDKLGRRAILRYGTLWMGAALVLHGFATTFELLLVLRFLAGTASGFLGGAAVAYIGDTVPYEKRGQAMGVITSGFALGQVVGIPMGTLMAGWFGYRVPFVVFGGVMLAVSALCWLALEDSGRRQGKFGIAEALEGYRYVVSRLDLIAVNLAGLTMMLSVSAFIVYQPLWIERTFDVDENGIALLFGVGGLANAVTGWIAGGASDRWGRKPLVLASSGGLGVCMLMTPFMPSYTAILALFVFTMCLVGIRISPLNAWVTSLVDTDHRGSLMAIWLATSQVGFALGSAVAGYAWTNYGFIGNALAGCTAALTTAVILALFVGEPKKEAAVSGPGA
ncbi:MAG: MFS transporter [Alphaproteobacteria bacterium]|nr:MFS transporter [Alphaproteobacteria bacterium]